MKKYVGTKHIEAEPMSMQEAYDKGLLQAGRMPVEGKEGYAVKYSDGCLSWLPKEVFDAVKCSDGYLSWLPKEVFDAAYEVEETPLDRLYIERKELDEKFRKLCTLIGKKDFAEVIKDEEMRTLLRLQQHYMGEYLSILNVRIKMMVNETKNK